MAQESPSSSLLSTVPDSPHPLARGGDSNDLAKPSSPTLRQPGLNTNGDNLPMSSTTTSHDAPPASALKATEKGATKHTTKRTREECDDANQALPMPKKSAREAKVNAAPVVQKSSPKAKTPNKPTTDDDEHVVTENNESSAQQEVQAVAVSAETIADHDADKLAEPEESVKKSKAESKTVMKKPITTSGRRRACDICKKRKVRCIHNLAEAEDGGEDDAQKESSPKVARAKVKTATKPIQPDEGNESVNPKAFVPDHEVTQLDGADNRKEPEEETPKKSRAKGKAAAKKAIAPPERTSTRNRKAPERFETLEERPPAKASPAKKGTSKVFDPVYITTNSTSRLGKADMYHMLLDDAAWTSLSSEQQATLVAMLPDTAENQQLLIRIKAGETDDNRPQAFGKSNDCFRTDVAKFQEDLRNGHLAKTWQAAAEQAVIERAAGEYDAWKAEEAELWWGQKSK